MNGEAQNDHLGPDAVLAALGEAAAAVRGGLAGEAAAPTALREALVAARRAGRPVAGSLGALRRLARLAADLEKARVRLLRLYRGRIGLALAMAGAARAGLAAAGIGPVEGVAPATVWLASIPLDAVALALAASLALAVYAAYARSLPRSWLLRDALTDLAVTWFRAHALLEPPRTLSCHASWQALRARELALGVDLSGDRRVLLEAWAEERCLGDAEALRRAEDRLPLAELAGLGLPLLLAFLAPALGALASSR